MRISVYNQKIGYEPKMVTEFEKKWVENFLNLQPDFNFLFFFNKII